MSARGDSAYFTRVMNEEWVVPHAGAARSTVAAVDDGSPPGAALGPVGLVHYRRSRAGQSCVSLHYSLHTRTQVSRLLVSHRDPSR